MNPDRTVIKERAEECESTECEERAETADSTEHHERRKENTVNATAPNRQKPTNAPDHALTPERFAALQNEQEETAPPLVMDWTRDVRRAAALMSDQEARFLVDFYYTMQKDRIAAGNQIHATQKSGEPNQVILTLFSQVSQVENKVKTALDAYTDKHPVGEWMKSVHGIGPVIAAGFLAHIDITKAPTAGHVWRFCGLEPSVKWLGVEGAKKVLEKIAPDVLTPREEGLWYDVVDDITVEKDPYAMTPQELAAFEEVMEQDTGKCQLTTAQLVAIGRLTNRKFANLLRLAKDEQGRVTKTSMAKALARKPWNGKLKTLCWKAGQSFIKSSGSDKSYYGRHWREAKERYEERNARGDYAEQAAEKLRTRTYGKDTEAYKALSQGKLPAGQINLRASRWAVKLFLSHLHEVWYEKQYGAKPPNPYPIAVLGHAHKIEPEEATA